MELRYLLPIQGLLDNVDSAVILIDRRSFYLSCNAGKV